MSEKPYETLDCTIYQLLEMYDQYKLDIKPGERYCIDRPKYIGGLFTHQPQEDDIILCLHDGKYEVIFGQEQVETIIKYYTGELREYETSSGFVLDRGFHLLNVVYRQRFLNYPLHLHIIEEDQMTKAMEWIKRMTDMRKRSDGILEQMDKYQIIPYKQGDTYLWGRDPYAYVSDYFEHEGISHGARKRPWKSLLEAYQEGRLTRHKFAKEKQVNKDAVIEKYLIDCPTDAIIVIEISPTRYEVIKGYEELETLLEFYMNKYALEDPQILTECKGATFDALPEDMADNFYCRKLNLYIYEDIISDEVVKLLQ